MSTREVRVTNDEQPKGNGWTEAEKSFWNAFHALYLHRNKLPLTTAYKVAVEKVKRDYPGATLPTISQARSNISKLDQGIIMFAREGEEATKKHYLSMLKREEPRSGVSIKTIFNTESAKEEGSEGGEVIEREFVPYNGGEKTGEGLFRTYMPINDFGIPEGYCDMNGIVGFLRNHKDEPEVIQFIADMMEE